MRLKHILIAVVVLTGGLVLGAAASAPDGAIPPCRCLVDLQGNWSFDTGCNGTLCSAVTNPLMVIDNLTCTDAMYPGPATIGGSVTLNYDSCTTGACVWEYHSPCGGTSCPANTTEYAVAHGSTATPAIGCCCTGGSGCTYTFEVIFNNSGTTCPQPQQNMHCRWTHQWQCG